MSLTNTVASTNIMLLALAGGLLYTIGQQLKFAIGQQLKFGYTLYGALRRPIVSAAGFGLITGRMEECMILGASIESIYLGIITPGGNIPTDYCAAACVGIPIWLATEGMTSTQAVALAVPVGLLFSLLTILIDMLMGIFIDPCQRAAERADLHGVFKWSVTIPGITRSLVAFVPTFLAVYLGSSFVQTLLDTLPVWLTHGLEVAGGILPALGFALTLMYIGRPTYIPLFLIGYFMVQYGGFSTMACALFAICVCLFITFFRLDVTDQLSDEMDFEDEDEDEETPERVLTTGDVNGFFMRWWAICEMSHTYQLMQAQAVCTAMLPALSKLYPDEQDKNRLSDALNRELMYFNTQGIWGSSVLGVALAMEEEQAVTNAMTNEEATASINGVKIGFMGPFAGVGDTLDWGILQYLLIGIGLPLCSKGNPAGILPLLVGFPIITIAEGLFFTNLGYRLGRVALGQLFAQGMVDRLIECASMIGMMMMMGSLGSSYVSLSLANETAQTTLDSIIPGLLPLVAIFVVYFIIKNVMRQIQWVSLAIIALGLLLALFGIC